MIFGNRRNRTETGRLRAAGGCRLMKCTSEVETRYHGLIRCEMENGHRGYHRSTHRNFQGADILYSWWDDFSATMRICPTCGR